MSIIIALYKGSFAISSHFGQLSPLLTCGNQPDTIINIGSTDPRYSGT